MNNVTSLMDSELRNCNKCGHPKDPRDFGHKGRVCSSCRREYNSNYYVKNKLDLNEQSKTNIQELNTKIFDILGKSCMTCYETELEFLTVDHVDNDRKQERDYMSHVWKRDLIAGKVDASKYQVLCRNCNEAKQRLNPVTLLKERILTGILKKCNSCLDKKDLCEFYRRDNESYKSICSICIRYNLMLTTIQCYKMLGGVCKCCGILDPYKLNIDHINNDGAIHRKTHRTGVGLCRKIIRGDLEQSLFQLLCANCNYSKLLHGSCIHMKDVS